MLNEAYVPQDIEQKTIKPLVGRIHATNYLYFIKKTSWILGELDIISLYTSLLDAKIAS